MNYGLSVAAHIPLQCARTLHELHIPGAVLHRGHCGRVRLLQGHQSLRAWRYSFSQDTAPEHGSHSLFTNISARVSHKFNAFFSSRPAKWFMHEGASRQRVASRSLPPCSQPGQPSVRRTGPRYLMRGFGREETTKRWVRPGGMPHRGTQLEARESLMRVLVGRRIAIDICNNDTCYYEVASTLIEKRRLLIS